VDAALYFLAHIGQLQLAECVLGLLALQRHAEVLERGLELGLFGLGAPARLFEVVRRAVTVAETWNCRFEFQTSKMKIGILIEKSNCHYNK
jgi:hypothetical protein